MPGALIWTRAQDDRLLEARRQGVPWQSIATELRVGRNAAISRAREIGLPAKKHHGRPPTSLRARAAAAVPSVRHEDDPPLEAGHPASWGLLLALIPSARA